MAVIKFKNALGQWEAITNYAVSPITPVQTTGSSTSDVMSQNAVTLALNTKANSADVYSKTVIDDTFLTKSDANSTFLTQEAATNNYLTKTEAGNTYLTTEEAQTTYVTNEHANATYVTETEVNNIVYGQPTKPEDAPTVVTTENLTTTLASYPTTTQVTQQITTATEGKADKATTLAGYGITDAKIEGGTITLGDQTLTPLTQPVGGDYMTEGDVDAKIASLVDSAPKTLDTLNELAAALGDDPNFATTITGKIGAKADKTELANYATTSALTSGLEGKADAVHTHTVSQITDLNLGNYATTTALTEGLAGKANSTHTHTIANVTGLQDALDAKATSEALTSGLAGKANIEHTHEIADVDGLQTALNGKAATDHTHSNYATTSSVAAAIAEAEFNTGHNTSSNIGSIPVTKRLVIATISGGGSFALASTPADGREIQVIVRSTGGGEISLPNSGNYTSMSGDSITLAAGAYADINVVSDGTHMYIRAL